MAEALLIGAGLLLAWFAATGFIAYWLGYRAELKRVRWVGKGRK